MKKVLIQGAFDILNAGHILAFKRAKGLGDELIVALNTDELYKRYKGYGLGPILPYWQRKILVESCKYVDKVVPINNFSPLRLIKRLKIDVLVLTREWEETKEKEIAYMRNKGGQISWSPRFKDIYCSSKIRELVIRRHLSRKEDLQ